MYLGTCVCGCGYVMCVCGCGCVCGWVDIWVDVWVGWTRVCVGVMRGRVCVGGWVDRVCGGSVNGCGVDGVKSMWGGRMDDCGWKVDGWTCGCGMGEVWVWMAG